MPQSTVSNPLIHSRLRLIRDEESPPYDAAFAPTPTREKRHMTVIADDVVETVAAQCGMAGLGLYTLLERRANTDGFAFGSYQDWADLGGMSRRHIIRLMDELVAGGWVEKQERSNQFGMQRTNAWKLPFHDKPRTYRGDTGGDIASDMVRPIVSPLKSSYVVDKESNRDTGVSLNGHSGAKSKPAPKPKETQMPNDFDLSHERMAYALDKGLSRVEADELFEEMRGWSLARGGTYLDWNAAWQNWVRRRAKDLLSKRPAANVWVPSHV